MGLVYLIEDAPKKEYKIGATGNKALNRKKELQTGNATELILNDTFETDYPFRLESMLHNKYKEYNVMNEWYDIPKEIADSFQETCRKLNDVIISMKDNPFFSKGLK